MSNTIYKTDLKYKRQRDLGDRTKMQFADEITETMFDKKIDLDTLEYRFQECRESKYYELDLCHMELKEMPSIPSDITDSVRHLFLFNNNLTEIDLNKFKALKLLDVSDNRLTIIKNVPITLEELFCPGNQLTVLPEIKNLDRLNCNLNKLTRIAPYQNLRILHCSFNKIDDIPNFQQLTKLFIDGNRVKALPSLPKLEVLDISKNSITVINSPTVEVLICNGNGTVRLDKMDKLNNLELFDTLIEKLDYFPNLRYLCCNKNSDDQPYGIRELSDKYKIIDWQVHRDKFYTINFF